MTRTEKAEVIESLIKKFEDASNFYVADSSELTVEQINNFRRKCFEKGVEITVVKNTLTRKALESFPEDKGYADLYEVLKGPSSLMFSETANLPAKIIEEFRKDHEKPLLKAAYIDSSIYIGDDELETLAKLKSKEELLGEVITLLESPMISLLGCLNSGEQTIMGLLSAIEEKGEE